MQCRFAPRAAGSTRKLEDDAAPLGADAIVAALRRNAEEIAGPIKPQATRRTPAGRLVALRKEVERRFAPLNRARGTTHLIDASGSRSEDRVAVFGGEVTTRISAGLRVEDAEDAFGPMRTGPRKRKECSRSRA